MVNSIGITSFLIYALKDDEDLMKVIDGTQIYPIDAIEGTSLPFMVVNRDGIEVGYDKLMPSMDFVHVTITVVASTYSQSIEIANAVRSALELKTYKDDTIHIHRIELEGVDETIYNNAYIQQLQFRISVS